MSTHPNVILMAVFTVDGTSRKTMRAILDEAGCTDDGDQIDLPSGKKRVYVKDAPEPTIVLWSLVMESGYNDGFQIEADEGSLVFFEMVTSGYGEFLTWEQLEAKKECLAEWARGICERHKCSYEIRVSANYW